MIGQKNKTGLSGYLYTATRDDDGNILELKIAKNNLTRWFAVNIGLYLLSRGFYHSWDGAYILLPTLAFYEEGPSMTPYYEFVFYFSHGVFHIIHPEYSNLNVPSGGGLGGVIWLADQPLIPKYGYTRFGVVSPIFRITPLSESMGVDIFVYPPNTVNLISIDCYSSGEGMVLEVGTTAATSIIKGTYTFQSNYTVKAVVLMSGGRPATLNYDVNDGTNTYTKSSIANIMAYRNFDAIFNPGDSLSVEWRIVVYY